MVSLFKTHPFGDLITLYRSRRHGLSQSALAEVSGLHPTVLSHMCNGRRLESKGARQRVLKVVSGLALCRALKSDQEANLLLRAARLADLDPSEPVEARLLERLAAGQSGGRVLNLLSREQGHNPSPCAPGGIAAHNATPEGRAAAGEKGDAGEAGEGWEEAFSFTVGGPVVHPRHFFGRRRELKRLGSLLRGPVLQFGAVIGRQRTGKTSLLRFIASAANDPYNDMAASWLSPRAWGYRWAYVDLRDPRLNTPKRLLARLLAELGAAHEPKPTLEAFAQRIRSELQVPMVVLMDNIDVAVEHYPRLNYEFWVGLTSVARDDALGRLGFIVSSSEPFSHMANHPVVGSSFFSSIGVTVELGPFTEDEAEELIASSPIPFNQHDVQWIMSMSGRQPMLLQLLCWERFQALEAGEEGDSWRQEATRRLEEWRVADG